MSPGSKFALLHVSNMISYKFLQDAASYILMPENVSMFEIYEFIVIKA